MSVNTKKSSSKPYLKVLRVLLLIGLIFVLYKGVKLYQLLAQTAQWEERMVASEYSMSYGNPEADTVFVITQGGPLTTLEPLGLLEFINWIDLEKNLVLNVHQAQTKFPEKFSEEVITFEEAKAYNVESVKWLAEVVAEQKKAGKKVYVLGASFGAFMVADLLATQGNISDGYIIAAGRLDMPVEVWKEFAEGRYVGFDGDKVIQFTAKQAGTGGSGSIEDQNMAKIAAGLGHKRYTELLKDIDLKNVLYIFGAKDEQVGSLYETEIDFLKQKGARVIRVEKNHGGTIDMIAPDLLKETFPI